VDKVKNLRRNKKLTLIFLMSLFLFAFVPSAMAFEGRDGENLTIEADEVIEDDLYIGANKLIVNGTIKGDLVVGASEILINGTVEGDLWAGGQTIEINGTVNGDVRVGGTAVILGENAVVGEDMLAFGYSIHNKSGSQVGQELVVGGFQALLEGDVAEDVWVGANSLQVNGRVGGNLLAEVGGDDTAPPVNPYQFMPDAPIMPVVPSGLNLGSDATIDGDLTYRAPQSYDVSADAVSGNIDFTQEIVNTSVEAQPSTGAKIWEHVRRFITLILIGALLIWKAPTFVTRLSAKIEKQPLPSLGWGALVYFAVPVLIFALFVAAILLALLFGGLQFGNLSAILMFVLLAFVIAFMVAFVLVLLYLTKIIVGYFIGDFILQRISPTLAETPYWSLLLGLLLVVLVIAVPYVGGLLNWLIAIVGVGTLWLLWRGDKVPAEKMA